MESLQLVKLGVLAVQVNSKEFGTVEVTLPGLVWELIPLQFGLRLDAIPTTQFHIEAYKILKMMLVEFACK